MKILIFGGTGMVGQGVLREALAATDVSEVMVVGRTRIPMVHAKFRQLVVPDLSKLDAVQAQLQGFDACFYCLGVSSAGMTEAAYAQTTHALTLAVASTLVRLSPTMSFLYVSGAGTDSTEKGRSMWARVKGQTENDLRKLGFANVCLFRPGVIQPLDGIVSKTGSYRLLYAATGPLLTLARAVFPNTVLTTKVVGRAMLNSARQHVSGVFEAPDIARLARETS